MSSQYDNEWFQASYSGGRIARLWHDLRLADPARFGSRLRRELGRLWGRAVRVDETRCHFWPAAFHHWRPVPGFDLGRAVRLATRPSPLLPGVFLAGEAFSSHQAWMEGALETAELAHAAYRSGGAPPAARDGDVHVEGAALDAARWAAVHPGGAGALAAHAGEDVTELMRHVGHSAHAWAVAHSLKRE